SAPGPIQAHRPVLESARPPASPRCKQSPPERRSRCALELKRLNRPHSEMRPGRSGESGAQTQKRDAQQNRRREQEILRLYAPEQQREEQKRQERQGQVKQAKKKDGQSD